MTELRYKGNDGCPLYAFPLAASIDKTKPVFIMLHGGGPDHYSLIPLADNIDYPQVVLPDIRGYGRSVCYDETRYKWEQYAADIISLLDYLDCPKAILCGAGIGTTISLRTAIASPNRIDSLILISIEDIEDDEAKEAEIRFLDEFAANVRAYGLEMAWAPILKNLSPVIGNMVRDAIPRSDPDSIAAAAAIGHDRAFNNINELSVIAAPVLIIPGADERHPTKLAEDIGKLLPNGYISSLSMSDHIRSAEDFSQHYAPIINTFLRTMTH